VIKEATAYEAFEEQTPVEDGPRKPRAELAAPIADAGKEETQKRPNAGGAATAGELAAPGTAALLEMVGELTKKLDNLESRSRAPARRRPKSELECFYCKEKGHFKHECAKLQAKEEREHQP
jgi:hypothetical protein